MVATDASASKRAWLWASTVVSCALALAALILGTAIAVAVVQPTVKGIVGGVVYSAATVIGPLAISVRSRDRMPLERLRLAAGLSLAGQAVFVAVPLAVFAM